MIKELIIAIVLGGLLGLGVTGSLITINRRQSQSAPPAATSPSPSVSAPPTAQSRPISPIPSFGLTVSNQENSQSVIKISSHQNGEVVNQSKVTIAGSAPADSLIVAAVNNRSATTRSKTDGSFSLTIDLDAGYNLVSITAIEANDSLSETELSLTYSTATF